MINNNRSNNSRNNTGNRTRMGNNCANNNCRNGNCRNDNCRNDNNGTCHAVMNQLRAVDFALTETVLYLNAYPCSEEAMKLYRKLVAQRNQLVDSYESQCGPLTMYGNNGDTWDWTEGPWPWEADAN